MTTRTTTDAALGHPAGLDRGLVRTAALAGLGLTSLATMAVLTKITLELGGTTRLFVHVAVAVALAGLVARFLSARGAAGLFVVLAAGSYLWYFAVVMDDIGLLVEAPLRVATHTVSDGILIATGQSVLTIAGTDVWAHSFAPAPFFLAWYFGFVRRYVTAGTVAGATMLLFVFSGDLGTGATLIGTIGVVMTVGFGTIELTGAPRSYAETLLVLIAAMAVVALLLPLVPSGGAVGPVSVVDHLEGSDRPTIESSVVGAGDRLEIIGEIEMNPEVRYSVEGEYDGYVRTGVYDYYTGSGWERTGDQQPFEPQTLGIDVFDDEVSLVHQRITPLVETDRLPSAGTPIDVRGIDHDRLAMSEHRTVFAPDGLESDEAYRVYSIVPHHPDGSVPTTATDVDERYYQLPDGVSQELYDITEEVIEGADGPHEKAQRIVSFLRSQKTYAHDVSVPEGDLASGFLFDMDAGYCTYFATTAVVMLRAADVPARLAVGYTSGQTVDEELSVVRGMNSHAWPEVYIDGHGWVSYEPTPGGPWNDVRDEILETAREEGNEEVDIEESVGLPLDHDPTAGDDDGFGDVVPAGGEVDDDFWGDAPLDGGDFDAPAGGRMGSGDGDEDDFEFPDLGDRGGSDPVEVEGEDDGPLSWLEFQHLVTLGLFSVGATVLARRYRIPGRVRHHLGLRYHRRRASPAADLERSADRLDWAMRKRFRPRRPGETWRTYHRRYARTHDDPAVDTLVDAVERARYGGVAEPDLADRAVACADEVVDDTVVFGGRLRPSRPAARDSIGDRIL